MTRSRGLTCALVVGVVALAAGAVVALRARTTEFGWFAYTPVPDGGAVPRFVTTREEWAWLVAGVGLAVVAGCAGYALGHRSQGPSRDPRAGSHPR